MAGHIILWCTYLQYGEQITVFEQLHEYFIFLKFSLIKLLLTLVFLFIYLFIIFIEAQQESIRSALWTKFNNWPVLENLFPFPGLVVLKY